MADSDISYMERTRQYYRAQGYTDDYRWAHFESVPFTRPVKALDQSRVTVVTTAMPGDAASRSDREVTAVPVAPPPRRLYTDHLSWDKDNTHTRDIPSFLPLWQLAQLRDAGIIGSLAPRFYCVPTEYSQRTTIDTDAPEILALCRQDQADIALLVPL